MNLFLRTAWIGALTATACLCGIGCQKQQPPSGNEAAPPTIKQTNQTTAPAAPQATPPKTPPPPTPPPTSKQTNAPAPGSPTNSPSVTATNASASPASTLSGKLQEARKTQQQLEDVLTQLKAIHNKARTKPEVTLSLSNLEAAAFSKMIEQAPDQKTNVQRMQVLDKKLRENVDPDKPPEQQTDEIKKEIQEYEALRTKLAAIAQKATQDPAVVKLHDQYINTLMAAMKKASPKTEQLLEQRQQLAQKLQSLRLWLLEQQRLQARQRTVAPHATAAPTNTSPPAITATGPTNAPAPSK